MRTLVNRFYNQLDSMRVENRDLPVIQSDEVQIKIHAAALNKADLFFAKGKPFIIRLLFGFKKPKHIYPGSDFSGEVVLVGDKVTQFKLGDKVFGDLSGIGFGAFSEMVNVKEKYLWKMPKGYNYHEASALPMPMGTALKALEKAGHLKNKNVLVYGGSGGVGRFLVQLALSMGASVDVAASKKHEQDLKNLGVTKIYDYQAPSFTLSKHTYDVIFAVNGYQPLKSYSNALITHGACIIVGGSGKQVFAAMTKHWFYKIFYKRKISTVMAQSGQDVLKQISELCMKTKIDVQIGKIYSLNDASKAYLDFNNGVYKGKYVIDMSL